MLHCRRRARRPCAGVRVPHSMGFAPTPRWLDALAVSIAVSYLPPAAVLCCALTDVGGLMLQSHTWSAVG